MEGFCFRSVSRGIIAFMLMLYFLLIVCLTINAYTAGEPGGWTLYPQSMVLYAWNLGPIRFILVGIVSAMVGLASYYEAAQKVISKKVQEAIAKRKAEKEFRENATRISYVEEKNCEVITEFPPEKVIKEEDNPIDKECEVITEIPLKAEEIKEDNLIEIKMKQRKAKRERSRKRKDTVKTVAILSMVLLAVNNNARSHK